LPKVDFEAKQGVLITGSVLNIDPSHAYSIEIEAIATDSYYETTLDKNLKFKLGPLPQANYTIKAKSNEFYTFTRADTDF